LLLFNCGNLNTVTGLQAGTARKLSSISDRGKGLLYCQKHANRNRNPTTVLFNWFGDKQPEREADNLQRYRPKLKDQPAVTAVTVLIASIVSDSCTFTFCW
jgi:hypothetical protein